MTVTTHVHSREQEWLLYAVVAQRRRLVDTRDAAGVIWAQDWPAFCTQLLTQMYDTYNMSVDTGGEAGVGVIQVLWKPKSTTNVQTQQDN